MPQKQAKVRLYQKISNLIDNFLDKDFDKTFQDPERKVVNLTDESGIKIKIDISKLKNI